MALKKRYTDDPTFKEHHNKDNVHRLVYTNEYVQKGKRYTFLQIIEVYQTSYLII